MRVRDLMTLPVLTARPDEPLRVAEGRMLRAGVGSLPVVDEEGGLLGVVSRTDLLTASAETRERGYVDEVMTEPVVTASPDDDAQEVAERMVNGGLRHVPVVRDGRVVGIVSHADFVRATLVPRHDDPSMEARRMVNGFLAFSFDHDVRVEVHAGVATLEGHVRTPMEAAALGSLLRRVPGVVHVANHLEYVAPHALDASAFVGFGGRP